MATRFCLKCGSQRPSIIPIKVNGCSECPPDLPPGALAADVPDSQTQLEDLLGHVRRCERWARLDDLIARQPWL